MTRPERRDLSRAGPLAPYVEAGVLGSAEVHVADAVGRATGEERAEVLLGIALAARAPRFGHVCVVPDAVAESVVVDDATLRHDRPLEWPDASTWRDALASSPAVRAPSEPRPDLTVPLVFDGTRLYLDRYWRYEELVATDLLRRAGSEAPRQDEQLLEQVLDRLFGGAVRGEPDRQREAALLALTRRLAVVAGGPGTGKTRTVARVLVATEDLAARSGRRVKVALAAPTGKAAARLTESVRAELVARPHASGDRDPELPAEASTIHRLLGGRPDGSFARDARDRLPHDLVVVDETSMVSLPLMARLLDAVRPDASVMLVGDPFQLASVEAGAVLGEIVGPAGRGGAAGPLAGAVVRLERVHRFGAGSALAALADAIRDGDTSRALALARDGEERALEWVDPEDHARLAAVERSVALQALDAVRAARDGDAAGALSRAGELKVLCAANAGQLGVTSVTARVEQLVSQELPGAGVGSGWYAGRPVVVSENDYGNRLFNGDVGITMLRAGRASVVFPGSSGLRAFAPSQLPALSTWWATTVHKAQGSEFERVVVMLPPPPSPVLTRELLYTAVTRSRASVTVVASEESWRAAISHPVARASGLGAKLWPTGPVRP